MIRKTVIFLALAGALLLAGCNKDAEFNAFIDEQNAAVDEIVKKVDADPGAAGVDAARKAFDARRAALKAKWDAIKDARGLQVSDAVTKKLEDSINEGSKKLLDVQKKIDDPEAGAKFVRLVTDFSEIMK